MVRKLFIFALALFSLTGPATAQFSGGSGGVKTVAQLEAACDEGKAQDCGDLGQRFYEGDGVTTNDKKAAAYFLRACDGGDGFGCAKLANAYDKGQGVGKDSAKVALYADRGCKAQDPLGCLLLGAVYAEGAPNYPKDTRRAESLLRHSCFGGNASGTAPDSISKLACPALVKLTGRPACETKTFSGNRTGTTCFGNDGRWQTTMAPVVVAPVAQPLQQVTQTPNTRAAANNGMSTATVATNRAVQSNLPLASPAQAKLLANAIAQDSKSWLSNRYDSGSLSGIYISTVNAHATTVRGNYTYNGGRNKGWASVDIKNDRVVCITYWDTYSCNTIRTATPVQAPSWQSEEQQERDRRAYEQRRREWQACISRNDSMLTNAYNICGYNP